MPRLEELELNQTYSRKEIHDITGGGNMQCYLPYKILTIFAGCFRTDLNTDLKNPGQTIEVFVGNGPEIMRAATVADHKKPTIPIFIKEGNKQYKYVGMYKAREYNTDRAIIAVAAKKSKRKDISGVLYFDKAD